MALYLGKDKIAGSGKSGSEHVYLTQEQYEALSAQGKLQASTVYMTPGGTGGGSGGDVGGLSSQISAHDARLSAHDLEMRALVEGARLGLSAQISAQAEDIANIYKKVSDTQTGKGVDACLDYSGALTYALNQSKTLSSGAVPYDCAVFAVLSVTSGTPLGEENVGFQVSVDGMAVASDVLWNTAQPPKYVARIDVPAGVDLTLKNTADKAKNVQVVPYRYGKRLDDIEAEVKDQTENVFKSDALSDYLKPVSVTFDSHYAGSGYAQDITYTGATQVYGGSWVSSDGWDDVHFTYTPFTFDSDTSGQEYWAPGFRMDLVLSAVQPVLLTVKQTGNSNLITPNVAFSNKYIYYAVGRSPKITALTKVEEGRRILVGTGQFLAMRVSANGAANQLLRKSVEPSVIQQYLYYCSPRMAFGEIRVSESSFAIV